MGCIVDRKTALSAVFKAIPLNFYSILSVAMVALVGLGIVKDFGPMKKAEERVANGGPVAPPGSEKIDIHGAGLDVKVPENPKMIDFIVPIFSLIFFTLFDVTNFIKTGDFFGSILCIIIAGAVAAIFAFLIGFPVLRLKSDYLAIATLGFAEILRAFFQWNALGPITNGSNLLKSFSRCSTFKVGNLFIDLDKYENHQYEK